MKIKITEEQAKRFKLISEDTNPLSQFEQFCATKVQDVNKLYSKVISTSVNEILNGEVNLKDINNILDKIEGDVHTGYKRSYNYINSLPDEDLDVRIDRASDSVMSKLTVLQLLVMDLEKLQLSGQQHSITRLFKDVKPMDITDLQA